MQTFFLSIVFRELDFRKNLFETKISGILMVVGWVWLIPSAVAAARYLREHWPENRPFGLKIWFHVNSLSY